MIDGFYSDPHFGHKNILKHCPERGKVFPTVDEMNEQFINNYNDKVGQNDTICWVGDCFFVSTPRAKEIMGRLNGNKILVIGNHDKSQGKMAELGFELVTDRMYMFIEGRKALVCHYPYKKAIYDGVRYDERFMELRPKKKDGELLIHGHIHSNVIVRGTMIHVGVDAWDYSIAPMDEIKALIAERFPTNNKANSISPASRAVDGGE